MITLSSRYSDGFLFKGYHSVKNSFEVGVYRVFPNNVSGIFYYTWVEGDRLDIIASKFLGDPSLWWVIMDYNDDVHSPFELVPGQELRIPVHVL
jgi:hypothetical protein